MDVSPDSHASQGRQDDSIIIPTVQCHCTVLNRTSAASLLAIVMVGADGRVAARGASLVDTTGADGRGAAWGAPTVTTTGADGRVEVH